MIIDRERMIMKRSSRDGDGEELIGIEVIAEMSALYESWNAILSTIEHHYVCSSFALSVCIYSRSVC